MLRKLNKLIDKSIKRMKTETDNSLTNKTNFFFPYLNQMKRMKQKPIADSKFNKLNSKGGELLNTHSRHKHRNQDKGKKRKTNKEKETEDKTEEI